MSQIPTWLTGPGVTAISITPQTVAADGTLTAGTNVSLTGHLDEIENEVYYDTEIIVPMDVLQDNEVCVATGQRMTLHEILSNHAGNFLAAAGALGGYIQATFARGGKAWTAYFLIKGYSENVRRGKSTGSLTLAPAGITGSYA